MTEQLKTLMDKAADLDFAVVDVDAITGAGDRTVRRRRIATGVAGVAALAVVATGAVLLRDEGGGAKTDFVDESSLTEVAIWTEGSALHTPGQSWDLGVDVATLVRTSEGIVYLGWDGKQEGLLDVFFFSGRGEPKQIGVTQDWRLVADPDQPYVGWLDGTEDDLEAVIYDVSRGERAWSEAAEQRYSFPVVAIDGTRAFLAGVDEGPFQVLDLVSGELRELPDNEIWRNFVATKGDLVARTDHGTVEGGDGNALVVGPVGADSISIPGGASDGAVFSPDGRWISVFSDGLSVHDTATGEAVAVDAGGYAHGLGYDWLDADTLLAIAGTEAGDEIVLYQCEIPAGTCDEVAPLGGFEEGELFAISFGESIWGGLADGEASGSVEVEASEVPPPNESSNTEPPE